MKYDMAPNVHYNIVVIVRKSIADVMRVIVTAVIDATVFRQRSNTNNGAYFQSTTAFNKLSYELFEGS
jgi:hypothetical protein